MIMRITLDVNRREAETARAESRMGFLVRDRQFPHHHIREYVAIPWG